MNLKDAEPGIEYTVDSIETDDEELNSFLFTLGCYSGEPITVISRLKGGYVVSVKDGRYNIDHNNNTDEKQFEESIFPQIFDEVARGCYVEQMDSFAKLFENSDFYRNVMTQMARVMYENYKKKEDELPFIPALFKERFLTDLKAEIIIPRHI